MTRPTLDERWGAAAPYRSEKSYSLTLEAKPPSVGGLQQGEAEEEWGAHRKASYLQDFFVSLVFAVILSHHGRTNRRPGLCYPAKDQRELAAERRRLKVQLVPDKRPLPEISSCAHAAW